MSVTVGFVTFRVSNMIIVFYEIMMSRHGDGKVSLTTVQVKSTPRSRELGSTRVHIRQKLLYRVINKEQKENKG